MRSWIFQGNPDRFDVDQYLRTWSRIYWTVSRKSDQERVSVGDEVFVWRARGSTDLTPGVVATGRVVEPCKPKSEILEPDKLSDNLWHDPGSEPGEVKAGVEVEEVRLTPEQGMVTLDQVRLDPLLVQMRIVTVRTGSNFLLPDEQALTLRSLWEAAVGETDEEVYGQTSYAAREGRILLRLHRTRERDRRLVQEAKGRFRVEHGSLFCEICGFSFSEVYGDIGEGYIEAHHKKPLSQLQPGEATQQSDLMMVCANCHRMIHGGDPEERLDYLLGRFS